MPIPDVESYPFDLELISASPENFDRQMRYLKAQFDPMPLSAFVAHIEQGEPLPKRPAIVTFDDGFDDNLLNAGPILAHYGIVPTIFLATDMVGSQKPYWFELVVYLMMKADPRSVAVAGLGAFPTGSDWSSRRSSAARLLNHLKRLPHDRMIGFLDGWLASNEDRIDPADFSLSRILDWERVRKMDGHGWEFGSHSRRHPVLANLDEATLRDEIIGSKQRLEAELGHPVKTIAYPVGKEFAFNPLVKRLTMTAGYSIGMSYVAGVNWVSKEVDLLALRRQSVERVHGLGRFEALTQLPAWVQW